MLRNRHAMTLIMAGAVAMSVGVVRAGEPVATKTAAGVTDVRRLAYPAKLPVDRTAEPLKIAFISYANPQHVVRNIGPIVAYLEPFVGVPVKGFVTLDYGSSVVAMRGKQADLATIDPLAFMMAHEQIGAKPLLLEVYSGGTPTYHSCIWVRRDSGIKTIEELKGKSIAFADQVDMSGHLLPRDIFVQKKLLSRKQIEGDFFKHVYFAGGDEQAIRAVLNKFVDAAGISQYAYLLLRLEERDVVTAIAQSIQSPSHLVMARKELSDEICGRIKQALLALDPAKPHDKAILNKLYGVQGYVEARLGDFSEVAKVAARYGFVKKPELFAGPSRLTSIKSKSPKAARTYDFTKATESIAPTNPKATAKPINAVCPFSGELVDPSVLTATYKEKVYGFCCKKCVKRFNRDPERAIAKLEAPI